MAVGVGQRRACIVYQPARLQQRLQCLLVSLEDGAVLVPTGYTHLGRHVVEVPEVLRVVGTEVFQFVAVIVDEPAVVGPSIILPVKGGLAWLHGPSGFRAKHTLMLRFGRVLSFTTIT